MARHFRIDELLKDAPEDREAFEDFARDPARTVDECVEWLEAKGYVVNRTSVWRWKQDFAERLMKERMSRSSELARSIKEAVKGGDFSDVADAAAMQLTQVVFEQASALEADGKLDPLDVQRMTRALANLVGSKKGITEIVEEMKLRQKQAVAEAEKAARTGASSGDVVETIKKALGISA